MNLPVSFNKWNIFYYISLLLLLITWSDVDNLPPLYMRFGYMFAVLVPLWSKRETLSPVILLTFVVISAASFAVSYMPVDGLYILLTVLISVMIVGSNKINSLKMPFGFILLTFLSFVIDLFFSDGVTVSFNWLAIILICTFFLRKNDQAQLGFVLFSFSIISLLLSLEFIVVGDRFISDVHTLLGDLDRKGWTDPNYFGSVVGMGVVTALISLITERQLKRTAKIYYLFVIAISLYTITATASRGAVTALSAALVVLLFLAPLNKKQKIYLIILTLLGVFVLYEFHFLDLLILRYMSDAGDLGGRSTIWIPRLQAFLDSSSPLEILFGLGKTKSMVLGTDGMLGFHNDYLAILVRYGFVGFACLLSLICWPLFKARKKGLILAVVLYFMLIMFSIEPFTGGQWGCLYFYVLIIMLSQVDYERNI